MGDVLHLQDDHRQAQMLLPWRVNNTLDHEDSVFFEEHLQQCAECRADLAADLRLRALYAATPVIGQGRSAPAELPPGVTASRAPRRPLLQRPVALKWAILGQAAAA